MSRALKAPIEDAMSADDFWSMIESRPDEERWQLVDGVPFMMTPATGRHQRIAANLESALNNALAVSNPELAAIREIGVVVPAHPDFRAIADVAVLPFELDDRFYFSEFQLVAEVLSPSNTTEHMSAKRARYADGPQCLHVLIVHQLDLAVELWSRSDGWQGRIFRSAEDLIELPEFGATIKLGDLYRGTPVK